MDIQKDEGIVHEIYHEIPTLEDLDKITDVYKDCGGCIVILNDIMSGWNAGLTLNKTFIELYHYKNVTYILIVQNLFFQNTECRVLGLNSIYLCTFKNPRDFRQISTLGAKMIPGKENLLLKHFKMPRKIPGVTFYLTTIKTVQIL